MVGKFLNLDDDLDAPTTPKIGSALKSKPKKQHTKADLAAVAAAGRAHGFNRSTETAPPPQQGQRRGRPPLNEDMTYWRIYVASDLRNELNQLRDEEGRRLNDVLADMLAVYREQKA